MNKKITSEEQFYKMTETPVGKLILTLAVPTIISALISVIYNTVDTFFVAKINKSAAAGVGVVFTIMSVIQAFGYGIGMGAGSLISVVLGEKKKSEADKYASSAVIEAFFFGTVVGTVGLIFSEPILKVLGCSETMLPYAEGYALFIFIAAPINCAAFVLNNALRAEGNTTLAMIGIGIGGVINVILDPIFIFTLDMGTMGASLATGVGQAVSFIVLLVPYLIKKSVVNVSFKNISKNIKTYGKIFSTGIPTVFRQGLGAVSSALLNIQAVTYGDAAVAAITISNKIYMFVRNLVLGIGHGYQPVAGYNYGAGRNDRVKKGFYFTCLLGTAACVVCAALLGFFAEGVMKLFSTERDVIGIGKTALIAGCAVMPFLAFSTYANQTLQSLGFKFSATLLASCRQGIFFIPVILIMPRLVGILGIQLAQPISDFLTFAVSLPYMIVFFKKRMQDNVDKIVKAGGKPELNVVSNAAFTEESTDDSDAE